ncbi:hypothetical protein EOM57_01360 [Candidatus Saccharibacteria bacterium]|nr:hypothetical protein [Candidatus Saccharibacteria bacterium]
MESTLLQIFLGLNLLLLGGLISLAIQFAFAHRRDQKLQSTQQPTQVQALPKAIRNRLADNAAKKLKNVLDKTSDGLEDDLEDTSKQLNKLLKQFGSSILDDEMKLFREHLEEIRRQTEHAVGTASLEIGDQQTMIEARLAQRQSEFDAKLLSLQTDLEQTLAIRQDELSSALDERKKQLIDKLDTEFVAERERLYTQIDTKLGDAVATFLTETLQHNVDLGAQSEYLAVMLEQHKDELKAAANGDSMLLQKDLSPNPNATKENK